MYSTASHAGVFVGVSVGFPPPLLPVYAQPICPGPDLLWTPGYWAYDPDVDDYYWVPGTWVRAPVVGYLWTPGYWGWSDGYYVWHAGYWGPHVGFYGGINYGFGYIGEGYHGGYWNHGAFVYNTAVTNVNTTIIHNTYNETVVVNHTTVNNVSFNGGSRRRDGPTHAAREDSCRRAARWPHSTADRTRARREPEPRTQGLVQSRKADHCRDEPRGRVHRSGSHAGEGPHLGAKEHRHIGKSRAWAYAARSAAFSESGERGQDRRAYAAQWPHSRIKESRTSSKSRARTYATRVIPGEASR